MGKKEVTEFVKWFTELTKKDVSIAGGKGSSLAEMYNHKFPIPPGFIITAQAYSYFIEKSGIKDEIHKIVDEIDVDDTKALEIASKKIRAIIERSSIPKEMESEIIEAYDVLDVDKKSVDAKGTALDILRHGYEPPFVAVRSSATTEDLAEASFAGQQESFLNVKGQKQLIEKIRACFASLFTARAIYYRAKKGFSHTKAQLSVVVQQMVDSDESGVIFSKNPIKDDNSIMIEAVWGLGEGIVSGMINPDNYIVSRDLENFEVKNIKVADKKIAVTRDSAGENKVVKLTKEISNQQVLSPFEIKMLSSYAMRLEEHYGKPQDIEFAISGKEIYIVQSRPITTKASNKEENMDGKVLVSGLGASPGVSFGTVKIINSLEELAKIKKGDILVTEMTNPDMVVSMQKAAGIVTNEGGITSHAAIVSREMGIPAVVGTTNATSTLIEGDIVTVDGTNGKVYEGKGEVKKIEIKEIVPTKTKIKVIVDLPDFALRAAESGAKSVGLVRLEGIIAEGGKHPFFFVQKKNMGNYEELLYKGLKQIAEPFEELWIRTSDLRSDEFKHLEGAPQEVEMNPMLGNHGARFSLKHKDIMTAEIKAMKALAENYKDKKIGIMIPQVISVDDLKLTKEIAKEVCVPTNVKIGIMVETPAAVQIINDLCEEGLNFISLGTNDLTQYTLAIDRNNESVQYLYDEMNPAVLNSIKYVIRRCKKYGVETSICGQAGSRPEMVKFLIQEGIDSISCNADAAQNVSEIVARIENSKGIEDKPKEEKNTVKEDLSKNENINKVTENEIVEDAYKEKEEVKEDEGKIEILMDDGESGEVKLTNENEGRIEILRDSGIEENKDIEEIILKELEVDKYTPEESNLDIPAVNSDEQNNIDKINSLISW